MPIKYKDRRNWKYELWEDYEVEVPRLKAPQFKHQFFEWNGERLLIRKGYSWDGPSGPTVDTKDFMRGSLVHDVLYQAMREGLMDKKWRPEADQTLRDLCLEDGMSRWRADYVFWAVDNLAPQWTKYMDQKDQDKILEAGRD